MSKKDTHIATINIRALPIQRDLIDRACIVLGKTRSDFMLEIACREAENIVLDQCLFKLDSETFAKFGEILSAPVCNNPALQNLITKTAPWES